jgi:membrane protein implicated in regulation of membrane protease activity
MDNPDNWMWIWLAGAVTLGIGEMLAAGSFFLAPFAVGAFVAFGGSLLGASVLIQWVLFAVVSLGSFLALRPIAQRLDASIPSHGVGATWLIGQEARVIQAIPEHGESLGMIRVERQEWRAESLDGTGIAEGTRVRVVEVRGTRVVVFPVELAAGDAEALEDPGTADDL